MNHSFCPIHFDVWIMTAGECAGVCDACDGEPWDRDLAIRNVCDAVEATARTPATMLSMTVNRALYDDNAWRYPETRLGRGGMARADVLAAEMGWL